MNYSKIKILLSILSLKSLSYCNNLTLKYCQILKTDFYFSKKIIIKSLEERSSKQLQLLCWLRNEELCYVFDNIILSSQKPNKVKHPYLHVTDKMKRKSEKKLGPLPKVTEHN